jgi:hypothetical protein
MTDEQKHSLVLSLISNSEALRDIEPTEVFPHLTAEDSDLLFVALVSVKDYGKDLSVALGAISEGLLGRII